MRAASILHPLVAPVSSKASVSVGAGLTSDSCAVPVYFSQLFVHRDSDVTTLHHLQHRTFAYNDGASLSGYHCLRFFLQSYCSSCGSGSGLDDAPDHALTLPVFSRIMATGGHLQSLKAVSAGLADTCCIDCEVLARLRSASASDPALATLLATVRPINLPLTGPRMDLAPVGSVAVVADDANLSPSSPPAQSGLLGPNPAQPVVASARLPASLRARILSAFIAAAHGDIETDHIGGQRRRPLLEPIGAKSYTAVTAEFYSGIRGAMCGCQGRDILCAQESALVAEAGGDSCYRPR